MRRALPLSLLFHLSGSQVAANLVKTVSLMSTKPNLSRPQPPAGRAFLAQLTLPVLSMAAIVLASNILVQFRLGNWLTWGALTYPFAFLVTDVTARLYGAASARQVVWAGFATGVFCSFVGTQIEGPEGPLVTLRIALGSGLAFLSAQMLDVFLFDRLKHRVWWQAPLASTLVGSTVDTFLFFAIAFSGTLAWLEPNADVSWAAEMLPLLGVGPVVPLWVSLATADLGVKLALALLALIPFRLLTRKAAQVIA